MSEVTKLSAVVLVGDVRKKISEIISEASDAKSYQLDTDYLATHERGILLKDLYIRNFAELE